MRSRPREYLKAVVGQPLSSSNHALHSPGIDANIQEYPHRSLSTRLLHTCSMLSPTSTIFPFPDVFVQTSLFRVVRHFRRMSMHPYSSNSSSNAVIADWRISPGHLQLVFGIREEPLHLTFPLRNRQRDAD